MTIVANNHINKTNVCNTYINKLLMPNKEDNNNPTEMWIQTKVYKEELEGFNEKERVLVTSILIATISMNRTLLQ